MDRNNAPLIPSDTPWLANPQAQAVCDALTGAGHVVYFVGGCVRNALLGVPVSDVDLSTDALPDDVIAITERAGLKAVPTGIEHGTVTIVSGGEPFEVTTFRRDVETDGRRAVVAFSTDVSEDARRRDFTMNAIYATPDGQIIDPLGGLDDLHARRFRFIEDAGQRIREDYLRTLRYFRFHALYADPAVGFDRDALDAIASNLGGLETLSAERVGSELTKLLGAFDPAPSLAGMRQTGVMNAVLPSTDDRWIGPLAHMEQALELSPNWIGRLVALGGDDPTKRLRLSKADTRMYHSIKDAAFGSSRLNAIAYREGSEVARQALLLRSVLAEQVPEPTVLAAIESASNKVFPIAAADLMPDVEGPALGSRLADLKERWVASDFTMTRGELLALPKE
ncbi:CCA tRNA nucleotidyltransferase [Sulfitobacter sp. SK012]|uniref:CCA tRNA nucleotidyltransferase n=1 Tax=Sulfitobacter sp. SK012 TaxID=1389005 RepID=UPI000E0B10CC|nr:CCA tRNA nucleotidyltransferase [Sulfitobacter sp. SK012]AXI44642.1 CCA tRNA nucleotidyltransferase [Sulfitobacter sp. SK012]